MMFKEVYPQYESCGLDTMVTVFGASNKKRHRANCYMTGTFLFFQQKYTTYSS